MDKHKTRRCVFHLDCSEITPECDRRCDDCISEMKEAFENLEGIREFATEGKGEITKVVIEHETTEVSLEELMGMFEKLPSRFKASFKPSLVQ